MKVLLKSSHGDLFIKPDGRWSPNETEASEFKTPLDAINFCHLNHLCDTSLVVCENEKRYEMPLRCDE